MTGRWKELFCVEVDKCTGRGPGGEVWFQVENMVMTRGRSHMERNVTKFSLPSITGRITTSLKKRRKDVVQLPNITGRVTKSCKRLQIEITCAGINLRTLKTGR